MKAVLLALFAARHAGFRTRVALQLEVLALRCQLFEATCVRRQRISLRRAGDGYGVSKRGFAAWFPTCHPALCAQGAAILARTPLVPLVIRHGWGGRRDPQLPRVMNAGRAQRGGVTRAARGDQPPGPGRRMEPGRSVARANGSPRRARSR